MQLRHRACATKQAASRRQTQESPGFATTGRASFPQRCTTSPRRVVLNQPTADPDAQPQESFTTGCLADGISRLALVFVLPYAMTSPSGRERGTGVGGTGPDESSCESTARQATRNLQSACCGPLPKAMLLYCPRWEQDWMISYLAVGPPLMSRRRKTQGRVPWCWGRVHFLDRGAILVSPLDIRHISELARLEPSEEELRSLESDLVEILSYISMLDEVACDGAEAAAEAPTSLREGPRAGEHAAGEVPGQCTGHAGPLL